MSESTAVLEPDAVFVIACPVCQGQVAATGSLCGQDACCPLCASLFHVPFPAASDHDEPAAVPEQAAQPTAGLAEDWGGVIRQLAPPHADPVPAPEPTATPPAFELPTRASLEVEAAAAPVDDGSTARTDLLVAAPEATEPAGAAAPPASASEPGPANASAQPATGGLPVVGGTPLAPKAAELVFSEPVRTVRHGDTVIEIRRLTPEERRARRFRRNLLMIVVGVSILLAIVVVFGVPKKP